MANGLVIRMTRVINPTSMRFAPLSILLFVKLALAAENGSSLSEVSQRIQSQMADMKSAIDTVNAAVPEFDGHTHAGHVTVRMGEPFESKKGKMTSWIATIDSGMMEMFVQSLQAVGGMRNDPSKAVLYSDLVAGEFRLFLNHLLELTTEETLPKFLSVIKTYQDIAATIQAEVAECCVSHADHISIPVEELQATLSKIDDACLPSHLVALKRYQKLARLSNTAATTYQSSKSPFLRGIQPANYPDMAHFAQVIEQVVEKFRSVFCNSFEAWFAVPIDMSIQYYRFEVLYTFLKNEQMLNENIVTKYWNIVSPLHVQYGDVNAALKQSVKDQATSSLPKF